MAENMSFMDSLWDSIETANIQRIEQNKKELNLVQKRKRLQQIQKEISQYYKTFINRKKNRTKWSAILGNTTYEIKYDDIRADKNLEEKFIAYMTQAYELTTKILADLNFIHQIRTVVTSIGDDYSYFRIPNFQLKAEYLFLNKQASSRAKEFGLRINQSKINNLKNMQTMTQAEIALSNHFQAFIAPFIQYQQMAINTTHWKVNKGVLGEAFERHLENVAHNAVKDLQDNSIQHLGSIGYRWLLYKESSGSDPFFTGPDTELSQVKNANASIVSSLQTLINTIEGILVIVDQNGELTKPREDLEKIFKQADFTLKMSQAFYEDLQSQAPEVVKEILESALEKGIGQVVLTNKSGKRTKSVKYKINEKNLTLEAVTKT